MILDTSAIVAIALKEPGFEELLGKLVKARNAGVGVPTLTETAIVLSARLNQDARGVLSRFLVEGSIATVPFGDAHFAAAVDAWLRYGKGRHTASLNFGDCLSYATAALAGEPVLCVGNDFAQTALPSLDGIALFLAPVDRNVEGSVGNRIQGRSFGGTRFTIPPYRRCDVWMGLRKYQGTR